jgi:hypothetical protein
MILLAIIDTRQAPKDHASEGPLTLVVLSRAGDGLHRPDARS